MVEDKNEGGEESTEVKITITKLVIECRFNGVQNSQLSAFSHCSYMYVVTAF